jgi:hypothetical protein
VDRFFLPQDGSLLRPCNEAIVGYRHECVSTLPSNANGRKDGVIKSRQVSRSPESRFLLNSRPKADMTPSNRDVWSTPSLQTIMNDAGDS